VFVFWVFVFLVTIQETGREERFGNDLLCVHRNAKRYLNQSTEYFIGCDYYGQESWKATTYFDGWKLSPCSASLTSNLTMFSRPVRSIIHQPLADNSLYRRCDQTAPSSDPLEGRSGAESLIFLTT